MFDDETRDVVIIIIQTKIDGSYIYIGICCVYMYILLYIYQKTGVSWKEICIEFDDEK